MADKELTIEVGSIYMLRWTVPNTPVTNRFMNPDGTSVDFPHPDPAPKGSPAPTDVGIHVAKKLPGDPAPTQDHFRKNRTAPFVARTTIRTKRGRVPAKVFSATFKAREVGEFFFTVDVVSENKSITQTMNVTPAKKRYRTIQQVIDGTDKEARRRQAILAAIADFFPAFNKGAPGLAKGADTGPKFLDQGVWVEDYAFNLNSNATSCTSVNPAMMKQSFAPTFAGNDETRWSFNAGPEEKSQLGRPKGDRGNRAWTSCTKDALPSVGDTYIALNKFKMPIYGHVGIVLEVPPSGNGLWVTADGGQGSKNNGTQLAIIVPRWGLMGAMLPQGGDPQGSYPEMKPEDEAGPFLGGGGPKNVKPNDEVPVPARHDDIAGMRAKIKYKVSEGVAGVPNPRRIHGFVDTASDKLNFDVDNEARNSDHIKKCKVLKDKVDAVIAAYLDGRTIQAKGT